MDPGWERADPGVGAGRSRGGSRRADPEWGRWWIQGGGRRTDPGWGQADPRCGLASGSRGVVRRVDPGVGSGGWIRVENQQVNPRGQAGRSRVEQVERSRLRAGKGAVSLVGPDPN